MRITLTFMSHFVNLIENAVPSCTTNSHAPGARGPGVNGCTIPEVRESQKNKKSITNGYFY